MKGAATADMDTGALILDIIHSELREQEETQVKIMPVQFECVTAVSILLNIYLKSFFFFLLHIALNIVCVICQGNITHLS